MSIITTNPNPPIKDNKAIIVNEKKSLLNTAQLSFGLINPVISNPALQYADIHKNIDTHIPYAPYLGINLIHKRKMAISSKNIVDKNIVFISPDTSNISPITPSRNILTFLRPNFFLNIRVKPVVNDTSPNAPICIKQSITICPNTDQFVHVSNKGIPVTQQQETHVNKASKTVIFLMPLEDIGRDNIIVPNSIKSRKLKTIICTGENFLRLSIKKFFILFKNYNTFPSISNTYLLVY